MQDYIPRFNGKVLGFRRWRVDRSDLSPSVDINEELWIKPFFDEEPWLPGENTSRCKLGQHKAPDEKCDCGYNAWDSYNRARFYKRFLYSNQTVTGLVVGSGLVYIHNSGWRAEKAEVVGLVSAKGTFVLRDWRNIEAEARELYLSKSTRMESTESSSENKQIICPSSSESVREYDYLSTHREFDKSSIIKRLGEIYSIPVLTSKSDINQFVNTYKQDRLIHSR